MSYRYTPEEIGMLNQEIDSLRAHMAKLEADLAVARHHGIAAEEINNKLVARVAELEAERSVADQVIVARENAIAKLEDRVANLEAALQPFTDPNNAPLMVLSDAWMAQLVDNARAVLAKREKT